jgi:AraC family transcriptional regulator
MPAEESHSSPLISKRSAAWDRIRLEHYRFGRGHFPEHQHTEHTAIVSLSGASAGELKTASGFRARGCGASGGVIVLPALRPHTVSIDGPSEYVSLFLDPSILARAALEAGVAHGAEIVESCVESDPVVANVAKSLLAEFAQESLGGRLYAESLANILTIHLLRHYTMVRPNVLRFSGGLSGARLRRVIAYMSDNYESDLSLTALAGEAGISPYHFAREFKKSTGQAPHQYLIKLRVERARALLAESELPIVEVGLRSGFSSQSHFTRLFRRLTGLTPKAYRGAYGQPLQAAV